MENKNNGRGIFYGVIGVATLVVAIIGATFAFFTATINTDNEAINVSAAKVSLAINTAKTTNHFKNNMIPVDVLSDKTETLGQADNHFYYYPGNDSGKGVATCVDEAGNSICSLYQITVENPAGSPTQNVEGYIQVTLNDGFENLHYAVFSGAIDDIETTGFFLQDSNHKWKTTQATKEGSEGFITYGVIKASATTQTDAVVSEDEVTAGAVLKENAGWSTWGKASSVELKENEVATYTIVLWLEDTNENQNAEMEAVMTAAVKFQSAQGSEVTGTITATGPKPAA